MNKLLILFLCVFYLHGFSQTTVAVTGKRTYLPSALINGRFYIKIPTLSGDTLLSFCDSGGGYNAIYAAAINKLHLEAKIAEVIIHGEKIKYIPASEVIGDPNIPAPHIQAYYQPYIKVPFFQTPANTEESDLIAAYIPQDAFLGQFFFIDHSWTFDYLKGKLYINMPLQGIKDKNTQQLGFKKTRDGTKIFGHPSMKIEIDGEVIDVLFDTGASILLSKNTQAELQSSSKSIGGSFIAKSIFDNWRIKHPDWRFIEKAEITGADMIQVPQVTIGTSTVGPAWFAKRPDENWSKWMIGSMDKVVKGAVGGSVFQYYVVTIDYNSELARFVKGK
jgi:hypothetical protein